MREREREREREAKLRGTEYCSKCLSGSIFLPANRDEQHDKSSQILWMMFCLSKKILRCNTDNYLNYYHRKDLSSQSNNCVNNSNNNRKEGREQGDTCVTIKSPSIHKSKTWHLYVNVLCYSLAITRILVCFANPDRTGEDEPTHDNCSPSNLCIVANMADMTFRKVSKTDQLSQK